MTTVVTTSVNSCRNRRMSAPDNSPRRTRPNSLLSRVDNALRFFDYSWSWQTTGSFFHIRAACSRGLRNGFVLRLERPEPSTVSRVLELALGVVPARFVVNKRAVGLPVLIHYVAHEPLPSPSRSPLSCADTLNTQHAWLTAAGTPRIPIRPIVRRTWQQLHYPQGIHSAWRNRTKPCR